MRKSILRMGVAMVVLATACSESGTETVSVTITGFQIFRAPCTATTIHAYLHTRNNGVLTPPNASETVAQGSREVNLTFR